MQDMRKKSRRRYARNPLAGTQRMVAALPAIGIGLVVGAAAPGIIKDAI